MRKIPMRRCVATLESLPKNELLRIVRTPDGQIKVDLSGKINGKGAYLKKSEEALKVAKKKNALARALSCEINDEVYDEILKVING